MKQARKMEICGIQYTVFECEDDAPELDGNEGFCDSSKGIIYIRGSYAEHVKIDTFLHEIVHAVFDGTGVRLIIHAGADAQTKDGPEVEEAIVRAMTGALRGALKSAGWREPKKVSKAQRKPRKKPGPIVPVETGFDGKQLLLPGGA